MNINALNSYLHTNVRGRAIDALVCTPCAVPINLSSYSWHINSFNALVDIDYSLTCFYQDLYRLIKARIELKKESSVDQDDCNLVAKLKELLTIAKKMEFYRI
jgi:hypothetical protein